MVRWCVMKTQWIRDAYDTMKKTLFYSNLGNSLTTIKGIYDVANKILSNSIILAVSPSWELATIFAADLTTMGFSIIRNTKTIETWDNVLFINFTYDELKVHLPKINYILINYIDNRNIKLCEEKIFEHDWESFTMTREMAFSLKKKSLQNMPPDYYEQQDKPGYNFQYFLPLNVYTDSDQILRIRPLHCINPNIIRRRRIKNNTTSMGIDSCIGYEDNKIINDYTDTATISDHSRDIEQSTTITDNIISLNYSFEMLPMLEIIEMKKSLQNIFTTKTNKIIYLDSTYNIFRILYKILTEELLAQHYFLKSISSPTRDHLRFLYVKHSLCILFKSFAINNYFADFFILIKYLRSKKKFCFVSSQFEYTICDKLGGPNTNNFIDTIVDGINLDFTRLKTGLDIIL